MNQEKSLYQIAFELDDDTRSFKNLSQSNFQQLYPEMFLRSTTRKRRQRLFSRNTKNTTRIESSLDIDSFISAKNQHTDKIIDGYCSSRTYNLINKCLKYFLKKLFLNKRKLNSDIQLILDSTLFDAVWYASTYSLKADNAGLVEHYLIVGFAALNDPSPLFSTRSYLENNPDIMYSKINPLVHYLRFGISEKRKISNSNISVN